ncbi:MAG: hypothetical protein SPL34_06795, partial [Selenomonadaceae bacterium]|nr:hypothetical protein [Selenomonadaceae bacterium]
MWQTIDKALLLQSNIHSCPEKDSGLPNLGRPLSSYYVNPQERKPQAQRDWLDLLQGRAHNVHKVDVCALSLLC